MRNDSMIRLITVTILGILGLWLIYTLIFGTGMGLGVNMGYRGYYGGEHMNMGYSIGYGNTFAYLLMLLVKVLFAVFVVALIVGIVVWVKNYVFTREDFETIKGTFSSNKTTYKKETCEICGKSLEAEWKLCPHCGKERG